MGNKVSKNREEFRSSLGLEGGRPIILYASKLTKRKRAMDLLEAYGRLVSRVSPNPSPYLLFVGDGEWRENGRKTHRKPSFFRLVVVLLLYVVVVDRCRSF